MSRKTPRNVVPITSGRNPRIAEINANNPDGIFTDLYLYLMTCSWTLLLIQIAGTFFLANVLFALAYYCDGGIENAHSFADHYFFSVETMATVGYGRMSPTTFLAHLLMSFEALSGLLGFAVVTGLIFAKFSRPTARIRFSRYAVIAQRDGVPSLMFRMANVRANQIVEAQIHLVFSRMEKTIEGESWRRFYDLDVVRSRNAIFAYSWTVVHQILPGSPFHGVTAETLEESHAWIVAAVTGLDETLSQTVHARGFWGSSDIKWGARLSDALVRTPDGSFALDFDRFDEIEPAELRPWDQETLKTVAEP
ncbi:MAG TPA: ion channel [Candidatus Binataceae bacterium]|nr:ion channel [Candidatus Binataceae bacterium]